MGLGWWRRKQDSSRNEGGVKRTATEVNSEQRQDRVVISAYSKVVDHKDRMDLLRLGGGQQREVDTPKYRK